MKYLFVNHARQSRLLIVYLALFTMISLISVPTVNALPTPNFCFALGDDGDRLHTMLFDGTSQEAAPQEAGVPNIESIAFNPNNQVLYAANGNTLGTLNYDFTDATNGGRYTTIGAFGTANGSLGARTISDVDGLTFDPFTGQLYAIERRFGLDPDLLIEVDIATGSVVANAFGPGIDYLVLSDNDPTTDWDTDVDDLAINPADNTIYAIANQGGNGDRLVTLDRATGTLVDLGVLQNSANSTNAEDMEGLSFFNDGTLYGTTGNNFATPAVDHDSLWRLTITSPPQATLVDRFDTDGDYEAVDCLTGDPNNKSGFVFDDANGNGAFDVDETPVPGVTVEIYRDIGLISGSVDADDVLLATDVTDANGFYDYDLAATGTFILRIDITTLPPGFSITDTNNLEFAFFADCNPNASPFDDFGCLEPNNNFETEDEPLVDLRIEKTDDVDPVIVGDTVTYTITITNDGPDTATNVTVEDTFSGAAFTVTGITSSQGGCTAFPCNLGTLAAAASATITITGTAEETGTIVNNVSVDASETDADPSNNTSDEETIVDESLVDLRIAKTDDVDPVIVGDTITYTITITNDGPDTATNVTVEDTFSGAAFTVTGITSSQGGCTAFPCNLGTLAATASATITITGTAEETGTIVNNVSVDASEADADPSNNTSDEETIVDQPIVNPPPPVDPPVDPPVEDPPVDPPIDIVIPIDPPTDPVDPGDPPTAPIDVIAPRQPFDATFVGNPISSLPTTTGRGLVLTKTADTAFVVLGDRITFTITVSNPTNRTITSVVVIDNLPSNYEVISVTSTLGTITRVGNRVSVSVAQLAPAASLTITIEAEAIAAGLPPQTCNTATLDDELATVCPQVFPDFLPQTGESPWTPFRSGLIFVLVSGALIGLGWQTRRWLRRDHL